MLDSCEDYLEINGISKMSFKSQIEFKNKVCAEIKFFEDNRYECYVWESEASMYSMPSAHYRRHCAVLASICRIIIENKDCTDEIKKICEADIENACVKFKEGLYNHPVKFVIKKDDVFCREVVAHYLLKKNPDLKDIIESEVDKWIDWHSSAEFHKSIMGDVFTISHYEIGLSEMLRDYLYDKHKIKVNNKN